MFPMAVLEERKEILLKLCSGNLRVTRLQLIPTKHTKYFFDSVIVTHVLYILNCVPRNLIVSLYGKN